MITPGAAGAFTMVITNTLCQQFTQLPPNYTGLVVSFVFGSVVFGYGASLLSRVVYFVINSLIIFVVAAGSSAVGVHLNEGAAVKTASLTVTQPAGGAAKTFGLASADKAEKKSDVPEKPPEKPKFFRNWL
jgi:amino acid permease